MTFGKAFFFLALLAAIVILWPIPNCYMHGFTVKWLPDRGIVCWIERPSQGREK